jgi:hypothetical protein
MMGGNPLLYPYPEMIDELRKFVPLPRDLAKAYRDHLAAITADPSKRPLQTCAGPMSFCGRHGNLSREHFWPEWR